MQGRGSLLQEVSLWLHLPKAPLWLAYHGLWAGLQRTPAVLPCFAPAVLGNLLAKHSCDMRKCRHSLSLQQNKTEPPRDPALLHQAPRAQLCGWEASKGSKSSHMASGPIRCVQLRTSIPTSMLGVSVSVKDHWVTVSTVFPRQEHFQTLPQWNLVPAAVGLGHPWGHGMGSPLRHPLSCPKALGGGNAGGQQRPSFGHQLGEVPFSHGVASDGCLHRRLMLLRWIQRRTCEKWTSLC